jgi:hypothetical protein
VNGKRADKKAHYSYEYFYDTVHFYIFSLSMNDLKSRVPSALVVNVFPYTFLLFSAAQLILRINKHFAKNVINVEREQEE